MDTDKLQEAVESVGYLSVDRNRNIVVERESEHKSYWKVSSTSEDAPREVTIEHVLWTAGRQDRSTPAKAIEDLEQLYINDDEKQTLGAVPKTLFI